MMVPSYTTAGHVHQKQQTDPTKESTKPVGHVWTAGQIHTQRERIEKAPAEHGTRWEPTDRPRAREIWRESRPNTENGTEGLFAQARDINTADKSIRETRLFTKF